MSMMIYPKIILIDENLAEVLVNEFSNLQAKVLHQRIMDKNASGTYNFGFQWAGLTNGDLTEKAIEHLQTECIITGDGKFYTELPLPLPIPLIHIKKYNTEDELDRHKYIIKEKIIPEIISGLEIGVYRGTMDSIHKIRDQFGRNI